MSNANVITAAAIFVAALGIPEGKHHKEKEKNRKLVAVDYIEHGPHGGAAWAARSFFRGNVSESQSKEIARQQAQHDGTRTAVATLFSMKQK